MIIGFVSTVRLGKAPVYQGRQVLTGGELRDSIPVKVLLPAGSTAFRTETAGVKNPSCFLLAEPFSIAGTHRASPDWFFRFGYPVTDQQSQKYTGGSGVVMKTIRLTLQNPG
jgi:hypothetical protein